MYTYNRLYSGGYAQLVTHYSGVFNPYRGYAECSPPIPRDPSMTDLELADLTTKIERGELVTVVVTGRRLADSQFRRIVVSSTHRNSQVTEIDAAKNQVTSNAFQGLVHTLSENTTIRVLNLAQNEITEEGIRYFLQILEQNITLVCINLADNPITGSPFLARLHFDLERNAQIQKEVERSQNYSVIIAKCMHYITLLPLVGMVLDYYNEATIPEARAVVNRIYYPSFLPQNDGLEPKPRAIDLSDNLAICQLANRMQAVYSQYKDPLDTSNSDAPTAANTDQRPLVFSQPAHSMTVGIAADVVPPRALAPSPSPSPGLSSGPGLDREAAREASQACTIA
jgi:hypothetical protein